MLPRDAVSQLDGAEEAIVPPTPGEIRDGVVAAAVELSRAWQDDVVAGVPSRFLFALDGGRGVAGWAWSRPRA